MSTNVPETAILSLRLRYDHWKRVVRDMQLAEDYVTQEYVKYAIYSDKKSQEKASINKQLASTIRDNIASIQVLMELARHDWVGNPNREESQVSTFLAKCVVCEIRNALYGDEVCSLECREAR